MEEHVGWDGRDGAEGEQLGAEGWEVRRGVEGVAGFFAVPVCCSTRDVCKWSDLGDRGLGVRQIV